MDAPHPIRVLELRSVWGTGGGPEKTILLGAAKSDCDRYAVTVCYIRDERDDVFGIDSRAGHLDVDYVEIRERHSFDRSIWTSLRRLVRERRIDIVHAHDYKTDLLALLLGRFESVIPLSTAHGFSGHGWKEKRVYYPADRRLLGRFPRVVVVSSDMRDLLVRSGARAERISVIPNGIDHEQFRRDDALVAPARERLGILPGTVAVGAVGRLEPEKNYPLLIRAFAKAAAVVPSLYLFIAGDGSLKGQLQAQIDESRLSARCRLLGQVADVVELHHALDLFVMCSDNEGSPNAVLEAMAMGTPAIATSVGGIPDLIAAGATGLVVARRDLKALAGAITRLAGDPRLCESIAREARQRVERELSFDQRMRRVERIYDELMTTYPGIRHGVSWRAAGHA
jgi:glycosyltransferase involved in cell wall biosynthesis